MLLSEETVRANLRNREGRRVYYLRREDRLSNAARDYLSRERIEILPAEEAAPDGYRMENGAVFAEKPGHFTHLNRETVVKKDHPRILLRGKLDSLEARLIACQLAVPAMAKELEEVLELVRRSIRCDVLGEPLRWDRVWGLTEKQLQEHSHFPQDHYGQPHFMPSRADGEQMAQLNLARCAAREAETAAVTAYSRPDGTLSREDIPRTLNRISSMVYLLMIRLKKAQS